MQQIYEKLNSGTLVAIGDIHSKSNARELTWNLLGSHYVSTLFIEFSNTLGRDGYRLNDALAEMKRNDYNYDQTLIRLNTSQYFQEIAGNDAQPTLIQLASRAIDLGISVAACDLDTDSTLDRINLLRDAEGYPYRATVHASYQDEGFAVRDDFAANQIQRYTTTRTGRLMLWGDNHFANYETRYIKANRTGVDVLRRNICHQLVTQPSIYQVFVIRNSQVDAYL